MQAPLDRESAGKDNHERHENERDREKGEESNYQNLRRRPQASGSIIGLFPFFIWCVCLPPMFLSLVALRKKGEKSKYGGRGLGFKTADSL
jgi:hypothetical protein